MPRYVRKNPSPLSAAIRDLKVELSEISDPEEKQRRILLFLQVRIPSFRTMLHLTSPLGICVGALFHPKPDEELNKEMRARSAAYLTTGFCDEVWEYLWDAKTGVAHTVHAAYWKATPAYQFVYQPFQHAQVIFYPLAAFDTGNRLYFAAIRREKDAEFTLADERALKRIGDAFSTELRSTEPLHIDAPTMAHLMFGEHTTKLDQNSLSERTSISCLALITRFYGPMTRLASGEWMAPQKFLNDIAESRADQVAQGMRHDIEHTFTKNYKGRLLAIRVLENEEGMSLHVAETRINYKKFRYILESCQKLDRDRRLYLSLCLLHAEGVRSAKAASARLTLHKFTENAVADAMPGVEDIMRECPVP